jgi:hypothetical protein
MEATFFTAGRAAAVRVRAWTDIPSDPAGEPLTVDSPAALLALVDALGVAGRAAITPLTDATCQSFPVWVLDARSTEAIAGLGDDRADAIATAWHERVEAEGQGMDADIHELATLLGDLRDALADKLDEGDELFVLLEQKAL